MKCMIVPGRAVERLSGHVPDLHYRLSGSKSEVGALEKFPFEFAEYLSVRDGVLSASVG